MVALACRSPEPDLSRGLGRWHRPSPLRRRQLHGRGGRGRQFHRKVRRNVVVATRERTDGHDQHLRIGRHVHDGVQWLSGPRPLRRRLFHDGRSDRREWNRALEWDVVVSPGQRSCRPIPHRTWFRRSLSTIREADSRSMRVAGSLPRAELRPIASQSGTGRHGRRSVRVSTISVTGLFSHDDGTGPQLWIGGRFTIAGATSAASIARWNGTAYSAVGAGFNLGFLETSVGPMIVFDPGSGPRLVVGGKFAQTGTTTVNNVAQWVGGTWVPLSTSPSGVVRSAGGLRRWNRTRSLRRRGFHVRGSRCGEPCREVERLDLGRAGSGRQWQRQRDGGVRRVPPRGRIVHDRWRSARELHRAMGRAGWSALGTGIAPVAGGTVNALIAFDSGTGLALHVGGVFVNAGGNAVINVARWSGTAWSAAGDGLNGPVDAFAAFDDGAGAKLYAGGLFATTGSAVTVNNVAKLSGTTLGCARDRDGRRGLHARRLRRRQRPPLRRRRVHERGWQRRACATRALGRIRVVERGNVARRRRSGSRARDRRGRDLSVCRR